jgi:glycosyltransferase involved in cell wall biosynthesis
VGKILGHLNQRLLGRELNSLLPKNGKRIVCYDSPTQDQLVGKLREDLSVYIAIDEKTLTVSGEPIQGEVEAEKRLLSRVDKVICVSERLAQVLRSRVPSGRNLPISVLPNGYDERIFDPEKNYPEPSDLARIPKPRALVAGHISERIDWEGIKGAVKSRPSWTWVFVGPADAGMVERINTIGGSTFYHPPVPVEEVPAWIRYCDACAVPYRLNPFTRASSPLKAIEYLAMGAPVLSTRIPALQPYGDVVHWVDESCGKSYVMGLDKVLEEKTDSGRMKARCMAVSNDSWARKAETFKALVLNVSSS